MTANFVPDQKPTQANRLGYAALKRKQARLEDGLGGYTTTRTLPALKADVYTLLIESGATNVTLADGNDQKLGRPAYLLTFEYEGLARKIYHVALPSAGGPKATEQAKKQCLYHLGVYLRAELECRHYQPDVPAFSTHVLMPGQTFTIGELLQSNDLQNVLLLAAPALDGELVDEGN